MKRSKKILSAAVAGTLVAAQMAMPVMAADGGNFDVDVTTKTGVLRVQVPTSMAVAVDQFMISTPGSQITASEFDMKNYSEMDVKVTVTSTATLASGVSLVSTAKAAEDSTGNEAWLGVAAKTSNTVGKEYDDLKTGTDDTPEEEALGELTDVNANVTSFASDTKKAEQTFYLAKGTGNATYNLAVPAATTNKVADEDRTFAKFYELTAITLASSDTAGLQAVVNEKDVYVVVTADNGKDGTTVTKIEKGAEISAANSNDYASTNTYYEAATDATALADLDGDNNKLYVYGTMATAGGEAGFTYIGKLSGNKETWTNTDISKISVAYTIAGITADRYAEVEDSCTYGLYTESSKLSAKSVSTSSPRLTVASGYTIKSVVVKRTNGATQTFTAGSNYTLSTADGVQSITFANGTLTYADNAGATVTITFNDDSTEDIVFN